MKKKTLLSQLPEWHDALGSSECLGSNRAATWAARGGECIRRLVARRRTSGRRRRRGRKSNRGRCEQSGELRIGVGGGARVRGQQGGEAPREFRVADWTE